MTNIDILYQLIRELEIDGETVANLFTNWHGNQLIDSEFMENVEEELGIKIEGINY